MSYQEVFDISRRLTAVSLEERTIEVRGSITRRISEFAARGTAQSSMALQAVEQVCAAGASAAVQIAWQNIWRVALNVGIEPSGDLAAQLKDQVRAQTAANFDWLGQQLAENEQRLGVNAKTYLQGHLPKARELALAQADAEIDLATASLLRRAEREGARTVYQFYAPVGAVVSGIRASASVVQNIGGSERTELASALDKLRDALARAEELGEQPKGELLDVVHDARAELERPQPNGVRLTSLLYGLGAAVQTVGSIEPAYHALKAAAALAGIQLP